MTPIETSHTRVLWIFRILMIVWIIISTLNIYLYERVNQNSKIGSASTCVLISFLDGSARAQEGAIRKQPNSSLNGQRRQGIKATKHLAKELRNTGVHCESH